MGGVALRAVTVGLAVEESRVEITAAWKRAVEGQLGGEAAIGYAVAPLLREMSLALRGDAPPHRAPADGLSRCAVLVRSTAAPGRVAREFALLRGALWEVVRGAGRVFSPDERRAADAWLDEALAASLDRLDRMRLRVELLERGPVVVPASAPAAGAPPRATPPASAPRPSLRPPPLPHLRRPPPSMRLRDPNPRANGAAPHGE